VAPAELKTKDAHGKIQIMMEFLTKMMLVQKFQDYQNTTDVLSQLMYLLLKQQVH